jgi:hypothetical protein
MATPLSVAMPRDAHTMAELIRLYVEARKKAKQWEEVAGGYSIAIMKNMDAAGVQTFDHDGTSVTRVADGLSSRLDKAKLVKNGVPVDVIEASTVTVSRRGYVRVETAEEKNQRQLVRAGMRSDGD